MTASSLWGQVPPALFTAVSPPNPDGLPAPGINAEYGVNVDRAALSTIPPEIEIDLPGYGLTTATLSWYQLFDGYDENGDPLPGTTPTDLDFYWVGKADEFDIVISAYDQCTAAAFVGAGGSYSLMLADGATTPALTKVVTYDHKLREVGALPVAVGGPSEHGGAVRLPARRSSPTPRPRTAARREPAERAPLKALDPATVIPVEMLAVYSELARTGAGGDPSKTEDDVHIQCLIRESIAKTNTTLINSDSSVRFSLAAVRYLGGLEPSGPPEAALTTVLQNATIAGWRDSLGGDVIGSFLRGWETLGSCGRAVVQRKGCGDNGPYETCDVGLPYKPYAYFIAAYNCARDYDTGIHETLHCMGAEHQSRYAVSSDRAFFYFSFGLEFPAEGPLYQTATAAGWDYRRVLYASNPNVTYMGYPTGIFGQANNALTVESSAVVVGTFEAPQPILIFQEDFETGDTIRWSAIEPPPVPWRSR